MCALATIGSSDPSTVAQGRQAPRDTDVDVRDSALRFTIFGPVRAWRGGVELDLGPPGQRALLALLLAAALELGDPGSLARAHEGLGQAYRALTRDDLAGEHWRQALEVLTAAGLDRTGDSQVTTATTLARLARSVPAPAD
jgi:hypothetical protein